MSLRGATNHVRQLQPPSQPGSRSGAASPVNGIPRRATNTNRSRAGSLAQRFGDIAEDEPLEPPQRPTISSRLPSGQNSPRRELPGFDLPVLRPSTSRTNSTYSGFEGPTSYGGQRSESPGTAMMAGMPRLSRVPTDPTQILAGRSQLRITKRDQGADVFGDEQNDYQPESPGGYEEHPRTASWSVARGGGAIEEAGDGGRRMPPPPPPSRAKKPPPPLPM